MKICSIRFSGFTSSASFTKSLVSARERRLFYHHTGTIPLVTHNFVSDHNGSSGRIQDGGKCEEQEHPTPLINRSYYPANDGSGRLAPSISYSPPPRPVLDAGQLQYYHTSLLCSTRSLVICQYSGLINLYCLTVALSIEKLKTNN
ncbi:hypothetical protein J6590_056732 [Homalodisca vitripennis]|nr:hypothetical protein J6590_056732 [Homalodisca vitripennis]